MKKIIISLSVITVSTAAALLFAADQASPTAAPEHKVMTPADLKWVDAPPGIPAGAKMAALNGDATQAGAFTVRLKSRAGYKIMPHTHPTAERVTCISGTLQIGMGEKFEESTMQKMGPGSYVVLPSGMAHYAKTTSDCVIQIDSEGPFQINYVNPSDDPRTAKQ